MPVRKKKEASLVEKMRNYILTVNSANANWRLDEVRPNKFNHRDGENYFVMETDHAHIHSLVMGVQEDRVYAYGPHDDHEMILMQVESLIGTTVVKIIGYEHYMVTTGRLSQRGNYLRIYESKGLYYLCIAGFSSSAGIVVTNNTWNKSIRLTIGERRDLKNLSSIIRKILDTKDTKRDRLEDYLSPTEFHMQWGMLKIYDSYSDGNRKLIIETFVSQEKNLVMYCTTEQAETILSSIAVHMR